MNLENKRHLCFAAAAFICGILLAKRPEKIWLLLSVLLVMACVYALKRCKNRKETVAASVLLAATALLAFGRCTCQENQYQKIIGQLESGEQVQICGTVCRKEIKEKKYLYYLKNSYYKIHEKTYRGGTVQLYYIEDTIPVGAVVQAVGEIQEFQAAANEGNFDAAAYYRAQNITFCVFAKQLWQEKPPANFFRERLYQLQKSMLDVFSGELNERDAGILSALTLGSKVLLEEETKQMYQTAGISHILAISGLHISVLGMSVYRFLRKCRSSYAFAAAASSGVVISFALMSGFGVSAKRAVLMYLLLMGAQVLGRTYDAANALAVAALMILIHNPLALFQSGFLFSFTAMLSILLTASLQRKNRKRKEKTQRKSVLERFWMSAAIQCWMMPLTAFFYYEVPVYALFLNLLVLPLCGCLLGFGILGGIAGLWFPVLSKWLLVICHLILNLFDWSMQGVGHLPGRQLLTGAPPIWLLAAYYLTLAAVHILLLQPGQRKQMHPLGTRIFSAAALCLLVLCLQAPKKAVFCMDMLDVGQGDGICIRDAGGNCVFIDGGSTSEEKVGTYRIYPFLKYHRIRSISAWIVTHADEDHISGLEELLEMEYPVERLLLAQAMPRDDGWKQLVELAEAAGTQIVYVQTADTLQLNGGELTCLYPAGAENEEASDRNALSQVWLLKQEHLTTLFTGDIGTRQEEALLERGVLQDVDLLKAAHHGSKNATSESFLEKVQPEAALISAGEKNRYGHPHKETLQRLAAAGSRVYCTNVYGQIKVVKNQIVIPR